MLLLARIQVSFVMIMFCKVDFWLLVKISDHDGQTPCPHQSYPFLLTLEVHYVKRYIGKRGGGVSESQSERTGGE